MSAGASPPVSTSPAASPPASLSRRIRSQSPWRESWRRLRRDRVAMAGLVIAAAMVLACLAAPLLAPCAPAEPRHWLGAHAPGFAHPDCRELNELVPGRGLELSERAPAAGHLEIDALDLPADAQPTTYRLLLRRGVVQITKGADRIDTLDLSPPGTVATLIDPSGNPGQAVSGMVITSAEPPPPGLFAPDEQVVLLRVTPVARTVTWTADVARGTVVALSRDGAPVASTTIRGEDIRRVAWNGRELRLRHLLGTDVQGRDLLARILYGGRISLMVGAVATLVSLLIGVLYGAIAGYVGGRTDRGMMAGIDVLYAIPFMFLVILLLVYCGRSLVVLFVALGAVQWLTMARIVRGQVLSLGQRDFILAARAGGASPLRIIARHLIPNCLGPVIVYGTLTVPMVIMEESFLAFIGLGVQQNGVDSWGALIQQGHADLTRERTWLLVYPALAMTGTLLALNCLGEGLRDALDPRDRGR